jgi:alpha,alpha-trehalase
MIISPEDLYGELFVAVQSSRIFTDGKTFVDAVALRPAHEINYSYELEKREKDFDLRAFVLKNFTLPEQASEDITDEFLQNKDRTIEEHIDYLWQYLTKHTETDNEFSSLIALPKSYIVPGGRFREIYYWDSYFTMLGLLEAGKKGMIENMLDNFSFLIDNCGHIPNGNRSYFASRSQPPFFFLMVQLLRQDNTDFILRKYKEYLQKEYNFWMSGDRLVETFGLEVNRYWDEKDTPRAESYWEDASLLEFVKTDPQKTGRHIRAACESGWDFSSRWLEDKERLRSIITTEIIPLDLNALLYGMESFLLELAETPEEEELYNDRMDTRMQFLEICWNPIDNIFEDYNYVKAKRTGVSSLAMMYPLFFEMVSQEQADSVAAYVEKHFLKAGGVMTTLHNTGQQWDAPNGWAPLQWITIKGLMNYGYKELALEIATRWTQLNERVFNNTGRMLEKYNVVDMDLEAGGGEYAVQDGFGWTNGVYTKLKALLAENESV